MPEGDTIFRAARTLHRALAGQTVTVFQSVLPALSRVEVDSPVTGRTVGKVEATGKGLLLYFSGDLILLTHMLLSGSWHIYRPGEPWQRPGASMRIVVRTSAIEAVAFQVPIAEFHSTRSLRRRRGFNQLGPDVLTAGEDDTEILSRLRSHPDLEVGEALLTQSVLAGIGNVYKSEICFLCGVHPFRTVSSLSISERSCLTATARKLLRADVAEGASDRVMTHRGQRRTTGRADYEQNLWFYKRKGKPCRRCTMPIEARKQGSGARVTFWCPACQPYAASSARSQTV